MSSDSMLHRLATTPLRDALRLRLTARLDRRRVLEEAALPAPVESLIERVVKRTRLWRLEKADVTRELAAHFADALDAGRTPDQATAEFGDPRKAARLIRRAKRRQRPLLWHAARRAAQATGAILLFVLGAYAVLAIRYHTGSPTVERDYLAEINARLTAAPPDERAWPLYREALLTLERPSRELSRGAWTSRDAIDDPDTLAASRAYIERHADQIALVREAAARSHFGAPLAREIDAELARRTDPDFQPTPSPTPDPDSLDASLLGTLLPQLGHMRQLARILAADAVLAIADDDAVRLEADLDALLGLASHAGQLPGLIGDLVSLAILHLQINTLADALRAKPQLLTDDQLVDLSHRLGAARADIDLASERRVFDDVVQRLYTDDGTGGGRIVAGGVEELLRWTSVTSPIETGLATDIAGPVAGLVLADRREITAAADRVYAYARRLADTPLSRWDELRAASPNDALRSSPLGTFRYRPVLLVVPAFEHAAHAAHTGRQRRDAILVALALELYRRDHGSWPSSLEPLTPRYLPAVPIDVFDAGPIKYRLEDDGPVVYSVGSDGIDDRARRPEESEHAISRWPGLDDAQTAPPPDADWILWPRPRDG